MSHVEQSATEPSNDTRTVPPDGTPGPKDELGYLQGIITEQEKHAFTVMAFMAAVIAGLATLVLSWKTKLSPTEVLVTGFCAVGAFSLWTLSHRALAERAILRVRAIENDIEKNRGYKGHQASLFLKQLGWSNWREAAKQPTFLCPLFIALGAVVGLWWLFAKNQDAGVGDGLNAAVVDAFKSHLTIQAVVEAKDREARVTAVSLPQQCEMVLAKDEASARWSISTIRCKSTPAPAPTGTVPRPDS